MGTAVLAQLQTLLDVTGLDVVGTRYEARVRSDSRSRMWSSRWEATAVLCASNPAAEAGPLSRAAVTLSQALEM